MIKCNMDETINQNTNNNELTMSSVSQAPSVMQTLERKNQIIELINGNLPVVNTTTESRHYHYHELNKRATSIRSDFSTISSQSGVSTRSMLSEAKAKLEAFSGKIAKMQNARDTNNNSGTNYLNLNKNDFENQSAKTTNPAPRDDDPDYDDQPVKDEQNYYETCDYIQTKF